MMQYETHIADHNKYVLHSTQNGYVLHKHRMSVRSTLNTESQYVQHSTQNVSTFYTQHRMSVRSTLNTEC